MTPTEQVFRDNNVKKDGTETTDALQKSITTLLHNGENIIFPKGKYKISDTIEFSEDAELRRVLIQGWGAVIDGHIEGEHDVDPVQEPYEEFQDISDQQYRPLFHFQRKRHEWHYKMEGFTFDGNNNKGVIGVNVHGMTQSEISNCDFRSCWVSLKASGWNNRYLNLNSGGVYIGFWLAVGDPGGCHVGSNMNELQNCRVFGGGSSWNKHGIRPYAKFLVEGGGNKMDMCTCEGKVFRYQVVANTSGNCMYGVQLGHVHTEDQSWEGVSRNDGRSLGIVEQRHSVVLNGWEPRWGVRSFKAGVGYIMQRDISVSGHENHFPRPWENIDRNVKIRATSFEHWGGEETAEAYMKHLGLQHGVMEVNGKTWHL